MTWVDAPLPDLGPTHAEWILAGADHPNRTALGESLRSLGTEVTFASGTDLEQTLSASAASSHAAMIVWFTSDDDDAPFAPVALLHQINAQRWTVPPKLWFVTHGAQSVIGRERVSVRQAALWGAARCIAEERPELWGGLVDLSPNTVAGMPFAQTLLANDTEDQIALRDGKRFALRLTTLPSAPVGASPAWRTDAAYLVTGGLGEIALRIAHGIVDAGVRRLVLLGRTALPPRAEWNALDATSVAGRRVKAVRGLEAKGAAVHLLTADVGDELQLASALDAYTNEAWPPIRGVVHAAGLLDSRLANVMDRATFDRVFVPKLNGALHLDRLLPDLDLFVLFSSAAGFLAQPGQANYAAANIGLDALALDRRARGQHGLSIAWGVWEALGLVREGAGARNVVEMTRQGFRSFSPEQGVSLFRWMLQRDEAMIAVVPMSWSEFRRARAGRALSLLRERFENIVDDGKDGSRRHRGPRAQRIVAVRTTPADRQRGARRGCACAQASRGAPRRAATTRIGGARLADVARGAESPRGRRSSARFRRRSCGTIRRWKPSVHISPTGIQWYRWYRWHRRPPRSKASQP